MSLHYLVKQKNTKIASFHSNALVYFTRLPTSRFLIFFYLVDSQLVHMLMCKSLNLMISELHSWTVKGKAIIKLRLQEVKLRVRSPAR